MPRLSRWRLSRLAALFSSVVLVVGCSSAAVPSVSAPAASAPAVSAPAVSAPASTAAASPSAPASASTAASGGAAGTVTAKESEFKIEVGATSAPAGKVTFQITNAGTIEHEFVVVRTDLAADKLPVSGGEVNEDDPQLKAVDEVEDIAVGATPTLTVDLPAGHYVLFCNISGHYQGGMHADFTTSG